MSYFPWSDEMSVGNRYIDADHRGMVDTINRLHDAMLAREGNEVLGTVLHELLAYTMGHFEREEAQMRAIDFSRYEDHKREHDVLLREVADLIQRFKSSPGNQALRVSKFLYDWLMEHILKSDMVLGVAIKAANLGHTRPSRREE